MTKLTTFLTLQLRRPEETLLTDDPCRSLTSPTGQDEAAASANKAVYTVTEVAALLGIGRGSAYQAVREGTIPSLRIGRRLVIPAAALERLLRGEAA